MKRYVYVLFYMVIILLLSSGCGNSSNRDSAEITDWEPTTYETVNDFDGVVMTVKEGTISPRGLTVIFTNDSDKQVVYGEDFLLEKEAKGNWYQVPFNIDDYGFNDIGYELAPSETDELIIDWDWLYESLDIGDYRVIKEVLDFREAGDYDRYNLSAEFTIE